MAGVNASQFNIPQSEVPIKRKNRISLRDLDDSYKNPDRINLKIEDKPYLDSMESNRETGSKLVANDVKTSSKAVANYKQSDSKLVAEITKSSSKTNHYSEDKEKVVAKTSSKVVANCKQTSSKVIAKPDYQQFTGLQKNLVELIYFSCRLNNSKSTKPISVQYIANELQTTIGTVKNATHRLIDKQIINKESFKNGRGGWTIYGIDHDIFNEISFLESSSKLVAKWKQTSSEVVAQPVAQPVAAFLSSSSLINTTTNYKADALAENKIQLTDGLIAAGFNQGHIEQLLRDSNLVPEEIQNSLNAFAFDLGFEDVKRKVRSPIGLIMKLLKNGQAYISEKGYESEEDRLYRELIERAEKKKEEKAKLETKLINIKFEEWLENISDGEKRNLVTPMGEFMGLIHREELKEYFNKEIYNAVNI